MFKPETASPALRAIMREEHAYGWAPTANGGALLYIQHAAFARPGHVSTTAPYTMRISARELAS